MKRKFLLTAAHIAPIMLFIVLFMGTAQAQESLEAKILRLAAQAQDASTDSLEIGVIQPVPLPLTGASLVQAKVLDKASGEVYGVAVDAEGNPVDGAALQQAERQAYRAKYGRLSPALYSSLQDMLDNQRLVVGVWLKAPALAPLPRIPVPPPAAIVQSQTPAAPTPQSPEPGAPSKQKPLVNDPALIAQRVEAITAAQAGLRAQIEARYQANLQVLSSQVAAAEAPLLQDLRLQGIQPTYASPVAPLVYVELTKSGILELAQRSDVDTIYGPGKYSDQLDIARPTHKATIVNEWWGYTGTGEKVAILEDNRIETANPYLSVAATRNVSGATDDHAAATSGIVASTHATYTGIARGASLYSANAPGYLDSEISAAMDWAVSQGVNIINNSWGGNAGNTDLNVHDRHLDWISRNNWQTITVAAGNENDGCDTGTGRVTSPARAYNVISVGNFDDKNTLTWADDSMDACSSYVNPSTGVEKPEVAASGSQINSTTNVSPWVAAMGSGTSFSSPMVAGEAALLKQRETWLNDWPEATKAIILASALHDIDGGGLPSSYDGAGGVDMLAAFHMVDLGWRNAAQRGTGDFPADYNFYAYTGETVRVAIAWSSNPAGDYSTDPMQADLDLYVFDPGASLIATSVSIYNNFEIVQFTAPSTGWYTARIEKFTFTGTSEFVGIAWWTGHNVLTAYTPLTFGNPPVSRESFRYNSPNFYWNAVGIRPPSGNDYDIHLYSGSPYGDPAAYHNLTYSAYSGNAVDFVLVDGNHAPPGGYFPETSYFSGSGGNYQIELATHSLDAGTNGPYTMTPGQVLRIWDTHIDQAVRKYFAVKVVSGDANLGMGLYSSDSANSTTWYQSRGSAVAYADAAGAGGNEFMSYLDATKSDWMGLVVWNNGATTNTSFMLYTDMTAPTGSASINSGATYANSPTVGLTLSGVDAETGVSEMRFSNDAASWTAWEAYNTSKTWTLTSGDGPKTVYVQYRNNAGMVSANITDSIVLDTVAPTGSISINSGATYATNPAVTLGLSASDITSGLYQMRFSNGAGWSAWEAIGVTKSWSLLTGDGSKTVYVQFMDNAMNISMSYLDSIILDTVAPTSSASSQAKAWVSGFLVTWSGTDATSGVHCYDVQYRVGLAGAWTTWLSCTTATSRRFGRTSPLTLTPLQTYYFRVRAHDEATNVEAYPSAADSSTFIDATAYLPIVNK